MKLRSMHDVLDDDRCWHVDGHAWWEMSRFPWPWFMFGKVVECLRCQRRATRAERRAWRKERGW